MISFAVPGPPVAKARPRFAGGRVFTPAATRAFEAAVGLAARAAGLRPDDGEHRYHVRVRAYFADRRRRDIDNVAKAVLDGLNGHAYRDDAQVDLLEVHRCHDAARPRTEISVAVLS